MPCSLADDSVLSPACRHRLDPSSLRCPAKAIRSTPLSPCSPAPSLSPSPFFSSTDKNPGRVAVAHRRQWRAPRAKLRPPEAQTHRPLYPRARNRRLELGIAVAVFFPFCSGHLDVEQAHGGLRPPLFAISVPSSSPHRDLSHGHLLFFPEAPEPPRDLAVLPHRTSPSLCRGRRRGPVPLRSPEWVASWATPCTARPRSSRSRPLTFFFRWFILFLVDLFLAL